MTLRLGLVDADRWQEFQDIKSEYFKKFHSKLKWSSWFTPYYESRFRGDAIGEWIKPSKVSAELTVSSVQAFLKKYGFMPFGEIDGMFGYMTQASVRLFQEYVRTIMGDAGIGEPDGRVGPTTRRYMQELDDDDWYCVWAPDFNARLGEDLTNPAGPEYQYWFDLLNAMKDKVNAYFFEGITEVDVAKLRQLEDQKGTSDTLAPSEWTFNSNDIHMIGFRCNHAESSQGRINDDLFVLLINGFVFKFWGSADPNLGMVSRSDEPYLVEGQHNYQLSWHKLSSKSRVYKALRPATKGVRVWRDQAGHSSGRDRLDSGDILGGMDPAPNPTINIHWTGDGRERSGNWSAGCQVISGRSYINHEGELINASLHSAYGNKDLDGLLRRKNQGPFRNKGAYTFAQDFILTYAGGRQVVKYTLGKDDTLNLFADNRLKDYLASGDWAADIPREMDNRAFIQEVIKKMREVPDLKKS